jgi:2,3-dihydroxy-p-cumate/2,3-dihydroxybenzoate 3,4-dioxygenase
LAKIQRLGHVVWATPHMTGHWFLPDVLNLRSDSLGEGITFYRAFPNPYHHGIGIGRSARNHFHHLNFMVTEVHDVGRAWRLAGRRTCRWCTARLPSGIDQRSCIS